MDLSLVIPCYNEAEHLDGSVATLIRVLEQTRHRYEVVFVDDGSRDGTRDLLEQICGRTPRCRYIFHDRNRGRGAAVKTGFAATTGRVTGFIDIDLEVQAHYIPLLVDCIERDGVDVATGHRHYLLRQTGGLGRVVLSFFYGLLLKFLLDFGVRDSETGCKFFRRETAGDVVQASQSDGWFWDTEVMARAALANLRIRELPVLFLRRWDKTSTVRVLPDSWRYLIELYRFRSQAGLGLLGRSPIYWTCTGYDLLMRVLYGGQYRETYAEVARRIPDGASVVDVCCGTGRLYRDFLRARGCRYLGLDANGHFVMGLRKRGVPARLADIRTDPIPTADYVVVCSSLYHVQRQAGAVLERLRAAARRAVIISEPVENLSAGDGYRSRLIAALTNPGIGEYTSRFDADSFRAFAEAHGARELTSRRGARNAIAVFAPLGSSAAGRAVAVGDPVVAAATPVAT